MCLAIAISSAFKLLEILVRAAKHPNRKRELEVRVRNRNVLIEHALDSFLGPRAVLNGPHVSVVLVRVY